MVTDSPGRILPDIYDGINHRVSKFNWPCVQQLPPDWMKIFNHAIKNVIKSHLNNNSLGKWLNTGHQLWQHFEAPNNKYISQTPSVKTDITPVDITIQRRHPVIGKTTPYYHQHSSTTICNNCNSITICIPYVDASPVV